MTIYSVMGPVGAPMKMPYASFAGKTPYVPTVSNFAAWTILFRRRRR